MPEAVGGAARRGGAEGALAVAAAAAATTAASVECSAAAAAVAAATAAAAVTALAEGAVEPVSLMAGAEGAWKAGTSRCVRRVKAESLQECENLCSKSSPGLLESQRETAEARWVGSLQKAKALIP